MGVSINPEEKLLTKIKAMFKSCNVSLKEIITLWNTCVAMFVHLLLVCTEYFCQLLQYHITFEKIIWFRLFMNGHIFMNTYEFKFAAPWKICLQSAVDKANMKALNFRYLNSRYR